MNSNFVVKPHEGGKKFTKDGATGAGAGGDACVVRGALAQTLRLSRALGLAPVDMTRSREDGGWLTLANMEPNVYGYIVFFTLHACVLSGLIIDLAAGDKKSLKVDSTFECAKWILEIGFMFVITTIGLVGARSRMKTIIKCLNVVETMHPQTTKVREWTAEEMKRGFTFLLCLLTLVSKIAGYIIMFYNNEQQKQTADKRVLFLYACILVEMIIAVLLEMEFVFVASNVNSALAEVNDSVDTLIYIIDMQTSSRLLLLDTGFQNPRNIPIESINTAIDTLDVKTNIKGHIKMDVRRMVSDLIISYGQVCDAVREINDVYEPVLVALVSSFLFYMVIMPHFLVICLYNFESEGANITITILSIIVHIIFMMVKIEPGHKIEREMHRTRLLVSQLVGRAPACAGAVSFQLDQLYKQVQLNHVSYAPMGVCCLNRPLVIEVFNVATTLITVILQYRVLTLQE